MRKAAQMGSLHIVYRVRTTACSTSLNTTAASPHAVAG